MTEARTRARAVLARVPGLHALARLTVETIRICLRYRVTGLASEAGYFALLSLPPLILGMFGGLGYVGQWLGPQTVENVSDAIQRFASQFLTSETVAQVLVPTVSDVLKRGRPDLISLGFLLSLWSGSRVLNVFVDTISIMYGQSGVRNMIHARALSLSLYVLALVVGAIAIPLVLIGPTWLTEILPDRVSFLTYLYWPVVTILVVGGLATLYYIATPRRTAWLRDLPGSALTLIIWVIASFIVRGTVAASLNGGMSIYGPLAAPIVVLIWLYFLAIAVLIGAALNAAIREIWPQRGSQGMRASARRAVGSVLGMLRRPGQPVVASAVEGSSGSG
ncbi:YihY/virulence factor BrkB family protein, partial [Nostocoides japonicum]|uniref:YihY/virulence factor BrkB family protein n=1 Tax=Nostocoides japonicum TaxID=99481 RepID=UPI00069EB6A7